MLNHGIIVFLILLSSASPVAAGEAVVNESPEHSYYIPSGIDNQKDYPLIIAFSPSGDAGSMINTWREVAEEYKWIILASAGFRNGMPNPQGEFSNLLGFIENPANAIPVDKSRIIVAGFSGGAMGAHMFAFLYPQFVSGVVANTGMINEEYLKQGDRYPRGKAAVFLASPADFRYREMKRDREFLQGLGWKTLWIEFPQGHTVAPGKYYKEAAQWLSAGWE
jgi:predicted esterase